MKTKSILAVAVLAAASVLRAASDAPKVELRGDSMSVSGPNTIAKGSAVATIGDFRVSAPEIEFDKEAGVLKCRGEATIRTPERTIKATDATITTRDEKPQVRASSIRVES